MEHITSQAVPESEPESLYSNEDVDTLFLDVSAEEREEFEREEMALNAPESSYSKDEVVLYLYVPEEELAEFESEEMALIVPGDKRKCSMNTGSRKRMRFEMNQKMINLWNLTNSKVRELNYERKKKKKENLRKRVMLHCFQKNFFS